MFTKKYIDKQNIDYYKKGDRINPKYKVNMILLLN